MGVSTSHDAIRLSSLYICTKTVFSAILRVVPHSVISIFMALVRRKCLVAVKAGHEVGMVEPTTARRLCFFTYIKLGMTGWLC
jgi:hypothetical protein